MKVTRLSLLVIALLMSVLAAPQAFGGGDKGGGRFGTPQSKSQEACDYYIYCNNGSTACCYGTLGECWDACESLCRGVCVYQEE
jgi:hypothetical protein